MVVRWYTPRISHIDMNVSDSLESGLGTVKGPPLNLFAMFPGVDPGGSLSARGVAS